MTMSKSNAARLIASGIGRESFQHDTLGHFDITALRAFIRAGRPQILNCKYSEISYDGSEVDALAHLVGNREVCPQRCKELTTEQLEEPLIFLLCPAGANGEHATHLLVDGIHRFVERQARGKADFHFYLIPIELAPRVDEVNYREVPWGEKELIPGKGLVPRSQP